MNARAAGLLLGFTTDRVLGDPARWHPVAGFGRVATALERHAYVDRRAAGVVHVAVLVGGAAALGVAVGRGPRVLGTAVTTWVVLGGTSLDREAAAVDRLLAQDRLVDARVQVARLVGRDASALDAGEIARATIESVAENTSDAVVAPLVLGAVAGAPGLLAYRAANTLDAMVGHRNERYERFGWAAARLDDGLNLAGARLTALLAAALAPTVGGSPVEALGTWRRDAAGHPSPNAGPVEASFAGALGIRLGGVNVYGTRVEDRHVLGSGRPAEGHDITRARTLARRVGVAAVAVSALIATRATRPPRRRR